MPKSGNPRPPYTSNYLHFISLKFFPSKNKRDMAPQVDTVYHKTTPQAKVSSYDIANHAQKPIFHMKKEPFYQLPKCTIQPA